MAMPWQLRDGLKRRPKGKFPPRPICEQLPSIHVNDLTIPRDSKAYSAPNISLRYPFLAAARFTWDAVEFRLRSLHRGQIGRVQTFQLKAIRTGFGRRPRHTFICDCGRPVVRLYHHSGYLGCKRCHNAINAVQAVHSRDRAVLQATRLQDFLDNKPRLFRHVQERLRKRLGDKLMRAQGSYGTQARNLRE